MRNPYLAMKRNWAKFYCHDQGFTLVELLIGLSIFSIISLSLYTTFANGITLQKRAQNTEAIYRDMRWCGSELEKDLTGMVPFFFPQEEGEIHKVIVHDPTQRNKSLHMEYGDPSGADKVPGSFVGTSNSFSLVLPGPSGLLAVRYYLESPEEIKIHQTLIGEKNRRQSTITAHSDQESKKIQFFMREERLLFSSEDENTDDLVSKEILSPLILEESLKFSYATYDKEGSSENLIWEEAWEEESFPVGVRVEFTFVDPSDNQNHLRFQKDIFIPLGGWGRHTSGG